VNLKRAAVVWVSSVLEKEGIQSLYDSTKMPQVKQHFVFGFVEEDDFDKAWALYQEWQKNPQRCPLEPKQEKVEVPVSTSSKLPNGK